ncbi:SHOCT-like domain-containing protein [Fusibacter ferrireducens]|uniref:YvlB/LiaX N-terminal domain-containing protein n=1 Tax=Fusibacter ferrireducens TaxID=2785058 RepID=A0ABR9ZRX6_9FIRM|nr:hypothetical protein [Fusibacter ferrireducens]MBF4693202.1 hypothetical protein [Fusibacter ferrireducens]
MSEDRLQILKLIENGTISSEEGLKLLDAVSEKREEKKPVESVKWVRLVVTSDEAEKSVDIKLPAKLFRVFGSKIVKHVDTDIDMEAILEMIQSGQEGEIMNITTDDGHVVSISLE